MDLVTITDATVKFALGGSAIYLLKIGVEEKRAQWRVQREADELRKKAFDAHILACAEKNTQIALMHQKLEALANQALHDSDRRLWMSECLAAIAAKMDLKLPERP